MGADRRPVMGREKLRKVLSDINLRRACPMSACQSRPIAPHGRRGIWLAAEANGHLLPGFSRFAHSPYLITHYASFITAEGALDIPESG